MRSRLGLGHVGLDRGRCARLRWTVSHRGPERHLHRTPVRVPVPCACAERGLGEDGEVERRVGRVVAGFVGRFARLRERLPLADRLWRAAVRYDEENGSRLAAAIAYYGFFATFALGVLVFAVLGATLAHNRSAEGVAEDYLKRNLPLTDVRPLAEASRGIGVIALVALVLA